MSDHLESTPTRRRRQREKVRRRREILDAARSEFWEHGFRGTTMPAIARAAELAPGTLYLYFPSKDALYAELLLEGYDRLEERLRKGVLPAGSARAQAAALIDTFFGFARDCPEYFDIIFFLIQTETSRSLVEALDEGQARRIEARQEICKGIAREVLARFEHHGDPREVRSTVEVVWAMLVGVVLFFRKEGPAAYAERGGAAKALILRAIAGE